MDIMINGIMSKKRINLDYPILGKEVAVISMFSNKIQCEIKETLEVLLITNKERWLLEGVFTGNKLNTLVGRKVITMPLDANDHIVKTDKLAHIMEVVISLDELDNTDNLEDGDFSNVLLRHHVPANQEFTYFEPNTPQYKKLKNGEFTSLTLRIMDQKNNILTDGPGMTIVLHTR